MPIWDVYDDDAIIGVENQICTCIKDELYQMESEFLIFLLRMTPMGIHTL